MTRIVSAFSDTPKTRTPSSPSARGFSLIELMVAMAMACIVLGAIYSIHAGLTKSYTTQNAAADVQEGLRAGIDFMAEDILMAGFDPRGTGSFGIVSADASSIRLTSDRNMNGTLDNSDLEDVQYFLRNTQLMQELYGDANTDDVLVDNVTGLTFTFWDGSTTPVQLVPVPPATQLNASQLADVRTIEVSMTVQAPAGRGQNVTRTYTTQFRCRNVGL
jgi:type IV pilus assembly protein PilW